MSSREKRWETALISLTVAMVAFLAYAIGDALISAAVQATGKWEEVTAFGALIASGASAVTMIGGMAWLTFVPDRQRAARTRPRGDLADNRLATIGHEGAVAPACSHRKAVPVDLLLTGERVAWLCPDCDAQLAADWQEPADVTRTVTAAQGWVASGSTCVVYYSGGGPGGGGGGSGGITIDYSLPSIDDGGDQITKAQPAGIAPARESGITQCPSCHEVMPAGRPCMHCSGRSGYKP